jgi:hypothetical protein
MRKVKVKGTDNIRNRQRVLGVNKDKMGHLKSMEKHKGDTEKCMKQQL